MIILGFFSWPVGDDFDLYRYFKNISFIDGVIQTYFGFSGRIFNWIILRLSLMSLRFIPYVSAVLGCFFVLFTFVVSTFLPIKKNIFRDVFYLNSIILITFWVFLRPFIPQLVYWVTGGIDYILPILLATIWLKCFFQLKKTKNILAGISIFFFSFLVGTTHEQISCVLLFIIFFTWVYQDRIAFKEKNLFLIIGLVFGIIVAIGAPGNFHRMNTGPKILDFSYLDNFLNVGYRIIDSTWKKAIICFISGIIQVLYVVKTKSVTIQHKISLKIWLFLFTGAAFFSMTPFYVMGSSFLSIRTLFFPVFLLSFMFMGIPYYFHLQIDKIFKRNFYNTFFIKGTIVFMCILFFCLMLKDYQKTISLHKQLIEREKVFNDPLNRNQDVIIVPIKKDGFTPVFFRDLASDPNDFINRYVAQIYNLKSVKVRQD